MKSRGVHVPCDLLAELRLRLGNFEVELRELLALLLAQGRARECETLMELLREPHLLGVEPRLLAGLVHGVEAFEDLRVEVQLVIELGQEFGNLRLDLKERFGAVGARDVVEHGRGAVQGAARLIEHRDDVLEGGLRGVVRDRSVGLARFANALLDRRQVVFVANRGEVGKVVGEA